MLRKILFAPDPPAQPEGGTPPVETPAPAAPPAQTPPPAATAVVNGKTENEVNLERQLEEERVARKKAETDAAYQADENRRLKEAKKTETDRPLRGWVFEDEE